VSDSNAIIAPLKNAILIFWSHQWSWCRGRFWRLANNGIRDDVPLVF